MTSPRLCYLICATPRSGSNFLCEVLTSTGVAGRPQEYFWNPPHWYHQWGVADFGAYFDRILQEGTTPNGVFGMKIMWYELEEFLPQLARLFSLEHASIQTQLAAGFRNPRFIWLTRHDRVRQAVSQLRAEQTGLWRSTDRPTKPSRELEFDPDAIDARLAWLADGERYWRSFFAAQRIPYHTVVYEELARCPRRTAQEILQYLSIAVPERLAHHGWQHQQQADTVTDDWVRRYCALQIRSL